MRDRCKNCIIIYKMNSIPILSTPTRAAFFLFRGFGTLNKNWSVSAHTNIAKRPKRFAVRYGNHTKIATVQILTLLILKKIALNTCKHFFGGVRNSLKVYVSLFFWWWTVDHQNERIKKHENCKLVILKAADWVSDNKHYIKVLAVN